MEVAAELGASRQHSFKTRSKQNYIAVLMTGE